MQTILVTGGLGYIGSHTVVELQQKGFDVVIIDDLSNSNIDVIDNIESITGIRPRLVVANLCTMQFNDYSVFTNVVIDGIIHFAASKAVGESVENPLKYYENNIMSLIKVLQYMESSKTNNLIFSSSCTVYGQPETMPITEETEIVLAKSPYGNTKQICEEIILDVVKQYDLDAIILRYFNPIGAHDSVKIGELPNGTPQNLLPYITQTASGIREKLSVFGGDYNTADGTCIRDYVHVVDIAKAHVLAIERLLNLNNEYPIEKYNLASGHGHSVMQVIESFERVSNVKLNYEIVNRRHGDVESVWANIDKAKEFLNWQPTYTLDQAVKSAWQWQQQLVKKTVT